MTHRILLFVLCICTAMRVTPTGRSLHTPSTLDDPCTVNPSQPVIPASDVVWIEDEWDPYGTMPDPEDMAWEWPVDTSQSASGTASFPAPPASMPPFTIGALWALFDPPREIPSSRNLVVYVMPSDCDAAPASIGVQLTFADSSNLIYYWGDDTVVNPGDGEGESSLKHVAPTNVATMDEPYTRLGNIPPAGQWTRLEIPIPGTPRSVETVTLVSSAGTLWWDHLGTGEAATTPHVSAVVPRYGPLAGGTSVRVLGSGFVPGDTEIYFGTTAATVTTHVSSTEVIVTAPSGTGTVGVQAVTTRGADTLAAAFTYIAPPTITSVAPLKGTIAGNQTIVIDGTNFIDGETAVAFGSAAATSVQVLSATRLTAVAPAHTAGPVTIAMTTPGGTASLPEGFRYLDAPAISAFSPVQGAPGTTVVVTGQNFDADAGATLLSIGGVAAPVISTTETQLIATIPPGPTTGRFTVSTAGGSALSATDFTVLRYTAISVAPASVTLQEGASSSITASGVLPGGATEVLSAGVTWTSADTAIATIGSNGAVTAVAEGTTIVTATHPPYTASATITVVSATPLPPDPATTAPPFEAGAAASFEESTAFLYTGPNRIQEGVAAGTIETLRASVIRGRVLARNGQPLSGVTVTVADHVELGHTRSRADGAFDLAVNGGGYLNVRFERSGYLPAERSVLAPWLDFVNTPDVVLIPLDTAVTTVTTSASATQVARGSTATDADGTRRATLMFAPGTSAVMKLPDGSTQSLSSMSIRATEYTVGASGPAAMPAPLPATSGYTYAVELTVDEALAANATSVEFSTPVAFYLENFLGFPAGTAVPLAWYDRTRHAWIPSPNGKVVRIVSTENGSARVDTDGDGAPDDSGLTVSERQHLGTLYASGATLWRAEIPHFSSWDLNWSVGMPENAKAPDGQPTWYRGLTNPACTDGSIIECENQTLGEVVPVTGAGIALHYQSDRTLGRVASRVLDVPAIGTEVPEGLLRAEVEVSIAGRQFRQVFPPQPNQTFRFAWSGFDVYGRRVPAGARVFVRTTFVYRGEYQAPVESLRSFELASGIGVGVLSRAEVGMSQLWEGILGGWTADALGFHGWTLTPHHFYDAATHTLYRGDGSRKSAAPKIFGAPDDGVLQTIAGKPGIHDWTWSDAGGPAIDARITEVSAAAVAPDGTLWMAAWDHVLKITPSGLLLHVAGNTSPSQPLNAHLSQPAATAKLRSARGIAVGPDGTVYIAEAQIGRVRKITPDGMIEPFAGDGGVNQQEEGAVALESALGWPIDVAVGPDGSVYIADDRIVRRVNTDGLMYTVAGNGADGFFGDGGPATAARFENVGSIALGPDGSVYITDDGRIRRVGPDGIVNTIAGNGVEGSTGDGGPATAAQVNIGLSDSAYLDVGPDGSVYFSEWSGRIRRIDPTGRINTIVGTGARYSSSPDGTGVGAASLEGANSLAVGPDGTLYFHDWTVALQRKVAPTLPTFNGNDLAIPDGQLVHIFDKSGRHLRTLNGDTGAELYHFTYDNGLLESIADADGNITSIGPSDGDVAIVAPGGQRTLLSGNTQLDSVTTAPGHTVSFEYTAAGLMTSMTDARNNETTFDWNGLGLLTRDAGPEGTAKDLTRTETANGHVVSITTAGGRTTTYASSEFPAAPSLRHIVAPSGLTSVVQEQKDGLAIATAPDGMQVRTRKSPDPVWRGQAPFTSTATMTWPSGRTLTMTAEREATFADPHDVLSVLTREDRVTVNGKTTTRFLDRETLTENVILPSGLTIGRTFDSRGRTLSVTPPGLTAVELSYDTRGRLQSVVQGPRTQTFGYNTKNELTSVEDAMGRVTRFQYDDAGRVTKQILPDLREIAYAYDANGNLTSVTPPGRSAHTFVFSGVNAATRYTPPTLAGTGVTEYVYNADQQLEQIVRAGSSIDFDYDGGGRLLSIASGTLSLMYGYNSGGNLASIAGLDASLTYSYDGSAPMAMSWTGAVAGSVSWTYDNDGHLFSETAAGQSVEFSYDDDGQLTEAGEMTITHRSESGLVSESALASTTERFGYDNVGDMNVIEHHTPLPDGSGNERMVQTDLNRDDAGRIVDITVYVDDTETSVGYHYDLAGRLDEVTYPGSTVQYTYDTNGNRTARQVTAGTTTTVELATYDAHDRLLTYDGTQYTYTANGELLTKTDATGTTGYVYDAFGNLRKVTLPNGVVVDYLIDAQNRRVGRKVDGNLTHTWLYADQLRIIAETDLVNGITKRFVYGTRSNVPNYMIANGTTYRIFSNHLGSPQTIVNETTNQTVQTLRYDEFGILVTNTNPGFTPFAFAGGLYDPATGLVRFGARDYDPRVGRWTAGEPLGFAGGDTNLYAYVGNDPVNWLDPSGLIKLRDMECADIRSEITRLTNELAQRTSEERGIQNDLLSGKLNRPNIENIIQYWRHRREYEAKQRRVKKLVDEHDRRPCDPDIPSGERDWASRGYPDDDYLWQLWGETLKRQILEGPPKPTGPVLIPSIGPIPIPVMVR